MKTILLAWLLVCQATVALAQTKPIPDTPAKAQLDAQASATVDNDELLVSMVVSHEGRNTHDITQSVLAQLQTAVAQARQVPGVMLQIGQVHTSPIWDPKGKTTPWRAQAELVLLSTNTAALAQLTSELTRVMRIQSVQFRLSDTLRQQTEKNLVQELALNFKNKASQIAQAFGFANYRIQSLVFSPTPDVTDPQPMVLMAKSPMADATPIPIPHESGKTTVRLGLQAQIELQP